MSKDELLRLIPLRKRGEQYVPAKDFQDIARILKSQKVDAQDLEFFHREIVARKQKLEAKEAS